LPHLLCVGGIISLPWFSKELKMTYRRTTCFVASSLYFLFGNQYSLGGDFPFPIVLVPRYKLSLCHSYQTRFIWLSGNCCFCVWVAWPRDHKIRIMKGLSWVWDILNGLNLLKPFRMWSSISKEKKTLWQMHFWYDPGKVKFGFWRKLCNYPVLRQHS
jgi:hypothetical protein